MTGYDPRPVPATAATTGRYAPGGRPPRPRALGLPWWALLGLALLGVPRVVLHDLDLIHEGSAVNLLFVVIPPLVWIGVAVAARVRRPLLTLLVTGIGYGLLLGLVHQLLWTTSFPGSGPSLGGNLADLDPTLQAIIFRTAAMGSSIVTGTVVGVLTGLLAEAVRAILRVATRTGR